jgi:hypothetical protein
MDRTATMAVPPGECPQRIGELDLVASAGRCLGQDLEDCGIEYVAADDGQIAGRVVLRLLDEIVDSYDVCLAGDG